MGHPRTHGKPRNRHSKRSRKLLRHKTNQIQQFKAALGQAASEHQKSMLTLLSVLAQSGGSIVITRGTVAQVQAHWRHLGWKSTAVDGDATSVRIELVDTTPTDEPESSDAERVEAEPRIGRVDEHGAVDDVGAAGSPA